MDGSDQLAHLLFHRYGAHRIEIFFGSRRKNSALQATIPLHCELAGQCNAGVNTIAAVKCNRILSA